MRTKKDKYRFIQILKDIPIISVACKKAGIDKATIYRWRAKDSAFNQSVEEALEVGRESGNDIAESKLLKLVNEGAPWAVKYWLEANSKRYYKPRKAMAPTKPDTHIAQIIYQVVESNKPSEPPTL